MPESTGHEGANTVRASCRKRRIPQEVLIRTARTFYAVLFFFFQAEDGIRDLTVTGVQTCALPISGIALRGTPAEDCDFHFFLFHVTSSLASAQSYPCISSGAAEGQGAAAASI